MPVRLSGFFTRHQSWVMVPLIFGIVLLCYWPALHGALLWDDPAHVPRPDLRSLAGLGRIWFVVGTTQQYYPVLFSAFWLEHQLWGDTTLGYHLVNLVLHSLSGCLLALVLQRLWTTPVRSIESGPSAGILLPAGAAWFAGLLFAVHPICVESVAWITEQKNTLSLVFYLLAGLAYLEYAQRRRAGIYFLASGFFLLALGSKTATVTLPAALLVVAWWKNGRLVWRRDIWPLVPWLLAALVSGLFTSWVERKWIGAEGADFDLALGDRIMLAGRIIWFYVGKLLWPADLNFFYPRWNVPLEASGWSGYLAAAVVATILGWVVRRWSRGFIAGWLIFIGSLFPVLGFFKVFFFMFSYVNDHFVYLASLAFIGTATGGMAWVVDRAPNWARRLSYLLGGVLVVALGVQTNRQCQLYRDNVTLFSATIAKNPESWMGHHILAVALAKLPDRREEAIAHYREALRLNPVHPDAHMGLAVELARSPATKNEALAEYARALQLRPDYTEAHYNLGVELARLPARRHEALAHFEQVVRLKPNFPNAQVNLANLLSTLPGREAEALAHYEAALRLDPQLPSVQLNLALYWARQSGHQEEAIRHAEEALRLKPDYLEAHNALAIMYAQQNRLDLARHHWEQALMVDPNYEDARQNLRRLEQMTYPPDRNHPAAKP